MAANESNQLIVPSILDRLIDENPGVSKESPKSRVVAMREFRRAVGRDLEALLNTRRTILDWIDDLAEIEMSLVDYGMPDLSGMDLVSGDGREAFRELVENRIRRMEPRFKSVDVLLLANADPQDRRMRFRIDAWLKVEPAPERVDFDSQLEPISRTFEVKGDGGE